MKDRVVRALPTIALTLAVSLVAVLGIQNRALSERNQVLFERYRTLIDRANGPYAGLSMPAFDAITSAGESVTVGTAQEGEKQLLFFFTATCPVSRRTIPAWSQIALETNEHDRLSIFGIKLDTVRLQIDDPDTDELRFPIIRLPDPRLVEWYRIGGVPATVVLDHAGRVLYSKMGEISERGSIEAVLAAVRDTAVWTDRLVNGAEQEE